MLTTHSDRCTAVRLARQHLETGEPIDTGLLCRVLLDCREQLVHVMPLHHATLTAWADGYHRVDDMAAFRREVARCAAWQAGKGVENA